MVHGLPFSNLLLAVRVVEDDFSGKWLVTAALAVTLTGDMMSEAGVQSFVCIAKINTFDKKGAFRSCLIQREGWANAAPPRFFGRS